MIVVTTVQIRADLDTPFYVETQPLVQSTFAAIVNSTANMAEPPMFVLSVDGLTHTSIAKYETQEQLNAFLAEVQQLLPEFFTLRQDYNAAHGITSARTITVV